MGLCVLTMGVQLQYVRLWTMQGWGVPRGHRGEYQSMITKMLVLAV